MSFAIVLVLLFVVMWLLVIRPQRRRQQDQQSVLDSVAPGAEVLTAGGLYGTVKDVGEDEVRVEIAPGTEVRVARRAIAAVIADEEGDGQLEELARAQREAEQEVAAGRAEAER